ncbi:hypothetical protein [Labrys sp. 22185]|uniref:hypothetical protein n=1 Tax=Labrys sp. 22185 TaxID=3453888 RepID=UPI003F82CAA1
MHEDLKYAKNGCMIIRLSITILSFSFYAFALCLPAIHGHGSSLYGLFLLLLGWIKAMNLECEAWLANPIFAMSLIFFLAAEYKISALSAIVAALVGLDTFRLERFEIDEAGNWVPFERAGSAFYAWELSFVILAAGALYLWKRTQQPASP